MENKLRMGLAMFKNIKRIKKLIRSLATSSDEQVRLNKLRAKFPKCTINSLNVSDAQLGEGVAILSGSYLSHVNIGRFSYVSYNSRLINVDMGSFCSIGQNVKIGFAPHPSKIFISTYPAFYSDNNSGCPIRFRENKIFDDSISKTIIANDVWIGSDVIVVGGITINTGAIVAAGSVVVKDVPPYAVVGGNPAQIIRYRFSENQIQRLLSSKWWEWPLEKIIQNVDNFADFEKFEAIVN